MNICPDSAVELQVEWNLHPMLVNSSKASSNSAKFMKRYRENSVQYSFEIGPDLIRVKESK